MVIRGVEKRAKSVEDETVAGMGANELAGTRDRMGGDRVLKSDIHVRGSRGGG